MREVNPEMVIIARESRGLSQSLLAKKMGITQGILSKIETGYQPASDELLAKLSNALDYPEKFFFRSGRKYPGISYHRKRKSIPQKALRRVEAGINILRIHFEEMLKNVEVVENNVPHFRIDDDEMSPSDIARAVRQQWMLPTGPIENLTEVVESAGCLILHSDFGTRMMDGLSISMPKHPPMIFINKDIPGDRLRFTIAHELGHIVMHEYYTPTMEDEANAFASEFLMPEHDIRSELTRLTIEKLASLKLRWRVSMQALLMRATKLNKISERNRQYLWMLMGKAGYRTHEPIDIPFEKPSLYKEIIDIHLDELNFSAEELCDVICIHEDEFERIYSTNTKGLRLIK